VIEQGRAPTSLGKRYVRRAAYPQDQRRARGHPAGVRAQWEEALKTGKRPEGRFLPGRLKPTQ
jgi:hypothetical protein